MDGKPCNSLSHIGYLTDFSRYPYPLLDAAGFEGRIGIFAVSAIVMALSTGTLKWLYGRVNGYGTGTKPQSRPGHIKRNGSI